MINALTADSRGRINFGPEAAGKTFVVQRKEDGEITLLPAVMIPEREIWLWQNPEALASLQRGTEDAQSRRVTEMSFLDHADNETGD